MAGTDIFAIIGKPVLQSKSPQMHNAAFVEAGLDAHYVRIAVDSREEGLDMARRMGIRGMNVTSPFKDIIDIVDFVDPIAAKAGAVNTVLFKDGKTLGHNTDVYGVSESFIANGIGIKGKKAIVLGAGGASRAAVAAMVENGAEVTIANRTVEKAKAMAREFGAESCSLSAKDLKTNLAGCQLVIGCLNTGERVVPAGLLRKGMAVMDAYYASRSALTEDGLAAGCIVIDGREWLLHQGAMAFQLFTGKKAPIGAMRKAAYAQDAKQKTGNIALVGMMGSGKDSVAKALSARIGKPVVDTDSEIVRINGMEINAIFADAGEGAFRKMEEGVIASLAGTTNHIINCGGGAVISANNRKILKQAATIVWLWADISTIVARVPDDGRRPLLGGNDPEKKLTELLAKRMGAYADASDLVLATDGKTPERIAERILYEVH